MGPTSDALPVVKMEDDEPVEDVKPDVKPSFLKNYYLLGGTTHTSRFPAPGVGMVEDLVEEMRFFTLDELLAIDRDVDPFAVSVKVDRAMEKTECFAEAARKWKEANDPVQVLFQEDIEEIPAKKKSKGGCEGGESIAAAVFLSDEGTCTNEVRSSRIAPVKSSRTSQASLPSALLVVPESAACPVSRHEEKPQVAENGPDEVLLTESEKNDDRPGSSNEIVPVQEPSSENDIVQRIEKPETRHAESFEEEQNVEQPTVASFHRRCETTAACEPPSPLRRRSSSPLASTNSRISSSSASTNPSPEVNPPVVFSSEVERSSSASSVPGNFEREASSTSKPFDPERIEAATIPSKQITRPNEKVQVAAESRQVGPSRVRTVPQVATSSASTRPSAPAQSVDLLGSILTEVQQGWTAVTASGILDRKEQRACPPARDVPGRIDPRMVKSTGERSPVISTTNKPDLRRSESHPSVANRPEFGATRDPRQRPASGSDLRHTSQEETGIQTVPPNQPVHPTQNSTSSASGSSATSHGGASHSSSSMVDDVRPRTHVPERDYNSGVPSAPSQDLRSSTLPPNTPTGQVRGNVDPRRQRVEQNVLEPMDHSGQDTGSTDAAGDALDVENQEAKPAAQTEGVPWPPYASYGPMFQPTPQYPHPNSANFSTAGFPGQYPPYFSPYGYPSVWPPAPSGGPQFGIPTPWGMQAPPTEMYGKNPKPGYATHPDFIMDSDEDEEIEKQQLAAVEAERKRRERLRDERRKRNKRL